MLLYLLGIKKSKNRLKFNKKEMFVIAIGIVFIFSVLYYISDYPLEMQRRIADPDLEHQNINFVDYFLFSLLSWVTGGTGQGRFSRVDWHWTTRMLYICQLLLLTYTVLFI